MFLHRLKNEFSENLKLLLVSWSALGIIVWSFYQWWFSPLLESDNAQDEITGIGILVICLLNFFLIATLFKRDDLKHPQEFWVTRPIRSFTLFGAKLVFAWLVIALPCAILITTLGLIAGVGFSAVWNGLEIMLWASLVTNLLALSSMAHSGNRAFFGVLCFFGGVVLTCILIINTPLENLMKNHGVSYAQMRWNCFIMLIALNALFGWKCWQLIRDKHRNQNLIAMITLGAFSVLVIIFLPIPGRLLSLTTGTPSSLPAITQSLSPASINGKGEKYGAKFASFGTELDCGDSLPGNDWEIVGTDLLAVGQDNAMLGMETSMKSFVHLKGQSSKSNLILNFLVFDRKPGSHGMQSSGYNSQANKIIAGVPLSKVRIQGSITLKQFEYAELARGPLDQPFTHREGRIVCGFDPRSLRDDFNIAWKIYYPPTLFSDGDRRRNKIRYRLEKPMPQDFSWTNQLSGNGMGGGAPFGSYQLQSIRIQDAEIESDFYWHQLKENRYEKSVQEWKKEARIVLEVVDRVVPVIIPVDVEIEVPDLSKVRELLLNGIL